MKQAKFMTGDLVKAVFTQALPKCEVRPDLKTDVTYTVKAVHTDSKGFDHIDVGLPMDVEYIKSFATGEILPKDIRWCHPNRFVLA